MISSVLPFSLLAMIGFVLCRVLYYVVLYTLELTLLIYLV
jgi:hypothetical protein